MPLSSTNNGENSKSSENISFRLHKDQLGQLRQEACMPDLWKMEPDEREEGDYDNNRSTSLVLIVSNENKSSSSVLTKYFEDKSFQVYSFTKLLKVLEHFKRHPKEYRVVISDPRKSEMQT